MNQHEIDVTPSPRLLQVLGDIPLQPWQCLAELIDNALDEIVRDPKRFHETPLRIDIDIEDVARGKRELVVRDTGFGMNEDGLTVALKAGATTKARYGTLGLFGMGFNIATARLGTSTAVLTSRAGDDNALRAVIDFAELQRTEKFRVPLDMKKKADSSTSGTEVRILLKHELADTLSSQANLRVIRSQLGDVYSYLLRDSVPGISDPAMSARIPAAIYVAGERVLPKLPCIWSDHRAVQSYGQTVKAVQYINVALTDATACLTCGYWDRTNGPTECAECGSTHLELRARRVWGWVGVQRYIDPSHFGVDFLRFGRKILKQDKNLFRYVDPDTMTEDVEYPIEMPANQGRLVGEIHLDHVPVTYQKNDFDRQHRDWVKAIEIIRGNGPMKPRGALVENTSFLARLFSAYRRNDPGLRYLTPGDGQRGIHAKAREWAAFFDKGVPRFLEDTEWYGAAVRHEEGPLGGASQATTASSTLGQVGQAATVTSGTSQTPNATGAGPGSSPGGLATSGRTVFQSLIGNGQEPATPSIPAAGQPPTREGTLREARALASERSDLSGHFVLGNQLGEWKIRVLETSSALSTPEGVDVPAVVGMMTGADIEILVNREHPVFSEFGRDIRDVALIQASDAIQAMKRTPIGIPGIYATLVSSIEDLKVTPLALQEQARILIYRVQHLMLLVVSESPAMYWEQLSVVDKQNVEMRAVGEYPNENLATLVDDGRFVLLIDGKAIVTLIRYAPLQFFDNKVFKASLEHRPPAAREKLTNKVTRLIEGLSDFIEDTLARQADDLSLARYQIESLARKIRSEHTL